MNLTIIRKPRVLTISKAVPGQGGGVTDHGALSGLSDDDHPQYYNASRLTAWLAARSADDLAESETRIYFTPSEKTKLAGIASGATANDTDANLKSRANHTGTQTASTISDFSTNVGTIIGSQKGVINGLVPLDENGFIPSQYLPDAVDEVLEYADLSSFPVTGAAGKIYIALDTNRTYRWGGSVYVEISSSAVTSVNGSAGAVLLSSDDIPEGLLNLYFTEERAVTAVQALLDEKADADDLDTLSDAVDLLPESNPAGITGASAITNIVSISESDYNALPVKTGTTLYVVT